MPNYTALPTLKLFGFFFFILNHPVDENSTFYKTGKAPQAIHHSAIVLIKCRNSCLSYGFSITP